MYKLDSGADWTVAPLDAVDRLKKSDIYEVDAAKYKTVTASGHELVTTVSGFDAHYYLFFTVCT